MSLPDIQNKNRYIVTEDVAINGRPVYRVLNTRTDRYTSSRPDKADAERWAAFLNEDRDFEYDADWRPGSRHNWCARNGGDS